MQQAVVVEKKSATIDALELTFVEQARPSIGPDECLIEVSSSGVNPSDVKAVLGEGSAKEAALRAAPSAI